MTNLFKVLEKYSDARPVPVFKVIKDFGLEVNFRSLNDDISGWIEKLSDEEYSIVINLNHAEARKRFTAAHELGHYIYHRNLLGSGTGDSRAYRSVAFSSNSKNSLVLPNHERQANIFAANLLMPIVTINTLMSEGVNDTKDLAEAMGVSEEAMRIRLGRPKPS